MTEPTEQDRRNAALRQGVAARFQAQFDEAVRLIEPILGEGWIPTGRHYLVTHEAAEHARCTGGAGVATAEVITAEKDGGKRHVLVMGEQLKECASYQDGFGAMLTEPDPVRGFNDNEGKWHFVHKYALHWGPYETSYTPRTAEQLADARERREEKKEAKWQEEVKQEAAASLFPEWIMEQAEEARKQKKGRKR